MELAVIEDRKYDLFAHDSTRYNKVYPDGNPLNENLGIKWQLVDIDFLVARTRGWIEIDKDGIQIKDRFCYQPPLGYLNYDKEEAAESIETRMGQRSVVRPWNNFGMHAFNCCSLCLFAALTFATELPESVKTVLLPTWIKRK